MPATDKSGGSSSATFGSHDREAASSASRLRRASRSISGKLMLSIFIVLVTIFSLLGYFSIRFQRKHLESAALVAAERQSDVLRRSASRYMLNNDRVGLYELM